MRERITARVLLFDPDGRVLLMKGRLPSTPAAPGVWFSVGGGAEPGESVLEAAAREIVEETGFTDAELAEVVWYREVVLSNRRGDPVLFKESYVVARCAGGEPSREGWQALERELVDDLCWWSAAEIRAARDEVFYPEGFADLLEEVLAGPPPTAPRVLSLVRPDEAG
ncbi:NUDIX hydrolase [Phenylobacterium sp.]|uniref:NUDIX hydrolase n=1 Tax=Phenylobacterium sp. TaxID=1871053 RepID=UPI0035B0A518